MSVKYAAYFARKHTHTHIHTNENSVAIPGLGMFCLEDMALVLFLMDRNKSQVKVGPRENLLVNRSLLRYRLLFSQ